MVFKKTTLVGRSAGSFDTIVDGAINHMEETLAGTHWVEVERLGVELASVETRGYQAEIGVAFELEGEDGE